MAAADRRRIVRRLCAAIRSGRSFFLSGHRKPDGDTVASELAMASLLRRLKKSVDIYNAEPVPESLRFLPGAGRIRAAARVDKSYDVAVIFECYDAERMGNLIDLERQAKTVINIDHHLHHSFFGDINLVNVQASSNSEQLADLFQALRLPITRAEATCLYAGILADTGRFQHSNTNAETLRIASLLVERGAPASWLAEKLFGTKGWPALRLLGHVLSTLRSVDGDKIVYAKLGPEDFRHFRAGEDDLEDAVNYGLQIPTALVSALFRQPDAGKAVKVSLRSRRGVDVCKLAQSFGGGGHKYASGCKVRGDLDSVCKQVLDRARHIV